MIWVGLVWAGFLRASTISMWFETFLSIFPFQYLQCSKGFTFLVATMILLRFLFREYRGELWTEENSKPMIWAGLVWAGLGLYGLGWGPHSTNNFHEIWNILLHFSFSVPSVLWRLYFFGGDGIYRSLDITKGKKTNDLFPPPLYFFPSDIDPTLSSSFLLCSWYHI